MLYSCYHGKKLAGVHNKGPKATFYPRTASRYQVPACRSVDPNTNTPPPIA